MADKNGQTLVVKRVPIDSVQPDPANTRLHPVRNLDAIKASLSRFGQQKPLVVDKDGVVRAGSGTLVAALDLGWAEIDVVKSELSGAEMAAYAVADNKTAELAEWNDELLRSALQEIQDVDELLATTTGFTTEEIAKIVKDGQAEPPEDFQQYDEDIEVQYECPKCGYCWSGRRTTISQSDDET